MSGFCLTLGYGKTKWDGCTWVCINRKGKLLDSRKFFINRFSRIVPLHYLINSISFKIFAMKGIGFQIVSSPLVLYTLTMTNSWTFIDIDSVFRNFPYANPTWTISTLTFFYWAFPLLLPKLQTLSSLRLYSLITIMFYLQCMPLYIAIGDTTNNAYWESTTHPLSRFPVFVMGMAAGIIRLRDESLRWQVDLQFLVLFVMILMRNFFPTYLSSDWNSLGLFIFSPIYHMIFLIFVLTCVFASPVVLNFLHNLVPWNFGHYFIFDDTRDTQDKWSWRVDFHFLLFMGPIVVKTFYPSMFLLNWNYIGQFLCVYPLLIILFGLTADGKKSITGKVFRFKFGQFLGKISMSLYMVHVEVWNYFKHYQGLDIRDTDTFAYVVGSTFFCAIFLTYVIEEPIRKFLRRCTHNL